MVLLTYTSVVHSLDAPDTSFSYTYRRKVSQYQWQPTLDQCNSPRVLDHCAYSIALPSTDMSLLLDSSHNSS